MSHMETSRELVQQMMERTYAEAPRSWPHGLHLEAFSPRQGENVYLVRTKAASTPVGFVGWQVRKEAGQRVGYYTVGFLPEHRGQGYAREAVQKLINIKSAGVDVVRALIQKDNAPSLALASKLGVDIVKVATMKALGSGAWNGLKNFAKSDTGKTLGAGAVGGATGMLESKFVPDAGHLASTGLPLTNAMMLMALANPRMRKDFFGAPGWKDLNTKALATFVGGKTLANGAIMAGDRGIGLLQNLGAAGKSVSQAAKSVENSTTALTSKLNDKVPDIINSAAGIAKGVESVTNTAAGRPGEEQQSASAIIRNLAAASKSVADTAEGSKATNSSINTAAGKLGEMAGAVKEHAQASKPIARLASDLTDLIKSPGVRTGGLAAAGGLAGYLGSRLALDDVPTSHRNYNRNRRLRILASLLGAGAGGAAAYATRPSP